MEMTFEEQAQKSHLMTCHYPDLGSAFDLVKQISLAAQPIRNTFLMCIVTRYQYGISVLVNSDIISPENQ